MNKQLNILILSVIILFTASCQKKDNTPADLSRVTVTFASPTQAVYKPGDTIEIAADVAYNAEITGVGIEIIDTAADSILFAEDHDLHTDHYTVAEAWINTLTDSATLCAKVSVFVANSTEKAERMIYFTVKP